MWFWVCIGLALFAGFVGGAVVGFNLAILERHG